MTKSRHAMELLTAAEVAKTMRVSRMTIYRMMHSGELPSLQFGRSLRVPATAVETYLEAAATKPAADKDR